MIEANKIELVKKAKRIIMLNLLDKVMIEVAKDKNAEALWAKLHLLYQMKV